MKKLDEEIVVIRNNIQDKKQSVCLFKKNYILHDYMIYNFIRFMMKIQIMEKLKLKLKE